jgi:hypothetical protein
MGKNAANRVKLYFGCRQYGDSGQKKLPPSVASKEIHEGQMVKNGFTQNVGVWPFGRLFGVDRHGLPHSFSRSGTSPEPIWGNT